MSPFPHRVAMSAFAFACLAACTSHVQTSSGADYLARAEASGATLSEELRAAAAVEPLLTFPARIGIARIENGRLVDIPADEFAVWADALKADGNDYAPVNLFIADLVATATSVSTDRADDRRRIIKTLQLGGARQHFDAILVYEAGATIDRRANGLAIANLSVIGAFIVPASRIAADAAATAILFDVRNGYPYAQVSATGADRASTPLFHAADRTRDAKARSIADAVKGLADETVVALLRLRTELADRASEG